MNTLSLTHDWTEFSKIVQAVSDCTASPCAIHGLTSSAPAFFAASYCGKNSGASVWVFPTDADCQSFLRDIKMLTPETGAYYLPWWGTVPYRPQSSGNAVFGERAATLSKILNMEDSAQKPQIFVLSQRSFQTPLPDPKYLKTLAFTVCAGEKNDPALLAERLSALGYFRVPKVSIAGEFSERGEVVDVVLFDGQAFRILFDFDKIEKIRVFDTETQATVREAASLTLPPRKEVLWDTELIGRLQNVFLKDKTQVDTKISEKMLTELETSGESSAEEYFYPLVFDKIYSSYETQYFYSEGQ